MQKKSEKKGKQDNKLDINITSQTVNEITKIIENIIEVDPEEIKIKRKNSFNCSNILKNKKHKNNSKIIKNDIKNQKKDEETENKLKLISLLENSDKKKSIKRGNSVSYKSENISEKKNKLLKNEKFHSLKDGKSSNFNLSSVKPKHLRNFVPKSEILKLNNNKSNFSSITDIGDNKIKVDLLFTKRPKGQDKFNEYQFFTFLYDKYNNNNTNKNNNDLKKNIISNTYMDNEEEDNEDIKFQIKNRNENRLNNYNNFINYFGNNIKDLTNNYYKNKDLSNENYPMKNMLPKNLNQSNYKKQISKNTDNNNFNINEINLNKFVDKIIQEEDSKIFQSEIKENNFANIQNIQNKRMYMTNNININSNRGIENGLLNNCNKNNNSNHTICNHYINNSYIFQNQATYYINYINKFYPNPQIPMYNQNNTNNNSFLYCNNYNNLNGNIIINNYQYINNYNQYNPNNINNINYINFTNDKILAKNAFNLSKTQSGCKLLQDKILSDYKFTNEILFPEIKINLKDICSDFFGNCLIKTILDRLSQENLDLFITLIEDSLFYICLSEPGSRSIQKLIEVIKNSSFLLNKFIFYLTKNNIGILFKSSYGNHILQKFLSVVKNPEFTFFIYDYILNNFMDIAKDKHGICVIQTSLSEADDIRRKKLLNYIWVNLGIILRDYYANFIIQFLFTKFEKSFEEILPIIEKLEENIVNYCKLKNSASVIEKCFEKGDPKISEHIINCIIDNHSKNIPDIVYNPFGFFIIKKSMLIQNKNIKERIMKAIIDNFDQLKATNNGRKIIEFLSTDYKEFNNLLKLRNK